MTRIRAESRMTRMMALTLHCMDPFVPFVTFVLFVICLEYRRNKDHVAGHIAPARSLISQDGQNHEWHE